MHATTAADCIIVQHYVSCECYNASFCHWCLPTHEHICVQDSTLRLPRTFESEWFKKIVYVNMFEFGRIFIHCVKRLIAVMCWLSLMMNWTERQVIKWLKKKADAMSLKNMINSPVIHEVSPYCTYQQSLVGKTCEPWMKDWKVIFDDSVE